MGINLEGSLPALIDSEYSPYQSFDVNIIDTGGIDNPHLAPVLRERYMDGAVSIIYSILKYR